MDTGRLEKNTIFVISDHFVIKGHLRPSRELLEYYRKKIAEYDEEHDHMVSKLEDYRVTYEEQVNSTTLNL